MKIFYATFPKYASRASGNFTEPDYFVFFPIFSISNQFLAFCYGVLTNSVCVFQFLRQIEGKILISQASINQFSGPAYPWGVAGAAA